MTSSNQENGFVGLAVVADPALKSQLEEPELKADEQPRPIHANRALAGDVSKNDPSRGQAEAVYSGLRVPGVKADTPH